MWPDGRLALLIRLLQRGFLWAFGIVLIASGVVVALRAGYLVIHANSLSWHKLGWWALLAWPAVAALILAVGAGLAHGGRVCIRRARRDDGDDLRLHTTLAAVGAAAMAFVLAIGWFGDDGLSSGGWNFNPDGCSDSYVGVCIPPQRSILGLYQSRNLNCADIPYRNFKLQERVDEDGGTFYKDPYGFDGDEDGIGCESSDRDLEGLGTIPGKELDRILGPQH